jgi:hypothetical protein
VKDSGVPTVSFDFAYTKAVEPGGQAQETSTIIALIGACGFINQLHRLRAHFQKNDFDVMVSEVIQFSQTLGHGECNFLCDNEPSIMQVQKRAVQARRAMGLMTHSKTPAADTHENTPAFAYTHAALKGNPRWQRVIVLGKTETQDTYVVFTGSTIMLTRSVRRIATDWKCHLDVGSTFASTP